MPVTVYSSADAGAPGQFVNTAGSLIAILDACLVNGYGSKAAAGWTKAFSGTNVAAYRMATAAPSTGMYLRIDDTNVNQSMAVGYESMTDVNTGVNPFPTSTQLTNGFFLVKYANNNNWLLIADSRAFYFYYYNVSYTTWYGFFFGDIFSRMASDPYACGIIGRTDNINSFASECIQLIGNSLTSNVAGHYLARSYNASTLSSFFIPIGKLGGSYLGSIGFTYPNPTDNNLIMDRVIICDNQALKNFRGYMPGMWNPLHPASPPVGNHGDTFSGTGDLAGRTFMLIGSYGGRTIIETSDTWRS